MFWTMIATRTPPVVNWLKGRIFLCDPCIKHPPWAYRREFLIEGISPALYEFLLPSMTFSSLWVREFIIQGNFSSHPGRESLLQRFSPPSGGGGNLSVLRGLQGEAGIYPPSRSWNSSSPPGREFILQRFFPSGIFSI